MYVCACVCMWVCVCMFVHLCVCMCMCWPIKVQTTFLCKSILRLELGLQSLLLGSFDLSLPLIFDNPEDLPSCGWSRILPVVTLTSHACTLSGHNTQFVLPQVNLVCPLPSSENSTYSVSFEPQPLPHRSFGSLWMHGCSSGCHVVSSSVSGTTS